MASHNITSASFFGYAESDFTTITSGSGFFYQSIKSKESKMRGLYLVYIIDPETDEIIHESGAIVANNELSAKLKTVLQAGAVLTKDIDDYDVIVTRIGEVRPKKQV